MNEQAKGGRLSASEHMMARALQWAPWLAFFLVALPFPAFFFLKYLTGAAGDMAFNMLMTLVSLAIGSLAGLMTTLFLLVYRRNWEKKIRDKMAKDGVTASELPWFMSELTPAERQALKGIEAQDPLLADAYRETLANRITAARVIASAKRELLLVERRFNRVAYLEGTDTTNLQAELQADRQRLEEIKMEGTERRAEAEARLQMIEAAASRGVSWAETNLALQRLGANRDQLPLALESARLEQQMLEDVSKDLRREGSVEKEQGLEAEG
ncbi:MAG TPA: hypothetical protein VGC89_14315 [Pyrinomonadaceae bacterium]